MPIGYKLFRKRKDGTYGPLFINRSLRLRVDTWYDAEFHPTKGYAVRPGWHLCDAPIAPHLSKKARVWCKVEYKDSTAHQRPKAQGGLWHTANRLRIIGELRDEKSDPDI
jgi:hypothetical protein